MIFAENTVGQRKICHKKKYHNESVALFSLFFRQQPCGLVSCCSRWLVCFLLFQMWSDLFEECGALQQLLLKQIFNMADHIFTVPTARLSPATSHFSNSTTWVFMWRSERLNKMQQESESNIPLTRAWSHFLSLETDLWGFSYCISSAQGYPKPSHTQIVNPDLHSTQGCTHHAAPLNMCLVDFQVITRLWASKTWAEVSVSLLLSVPGLCQCERFVARGWVQCEEHFWWLSEIPKCQHITIREGSCCFQTAHRTKIRDKDNKTYFSYGLKLLKQLRINITLTIFGRNQLHSASQYGCMNLFQLYTWRSCDLRIKKCHLKQKESLGLSLNLLYW